MELSPKPRLMDEPIPRMVEALGVGDTPGSHTLTDGAAAGAHQ